MKNLLYFIGKGVLLMLIVAHFLNCGKTKPNSTNPGKVSTATGLPFNQEGGFEVKPFSGQAVPPSMVFVPGGSIIMGLHGENADRGAKVPVTVTSFFIKETKVVNQEWNEYLHYQQGESDEAYQAALPNDSVWVRELGYNDPYIHGYRVHPAFRFYPVVGVSWTQANAYCEWLTKQINKHLAEKADIPYNPEEEGELPIDTGIFVSRCRLATEAEWERAARGDILPATTKEADFATINQRIYPWGDGLSLRGKEGLWKGKYMANFKWSKGNYKGVPGEADTSAPTSYVYEYPPNNLGIYDMVGNVCEWVVDVYRPQSNEQVDDFNPIRRDGTLDPSEVYDPTHSLVNDNAMVYKGASWKDCAYWTQIGTRRYLDKDSCSATIGFRYVVTSMGDPTRAQQAN
jgi:sulfatase modifying factor 1